MAEGKFISYLRVSTDKQGRSGLGIEAEREAVVRYLNGGQWTLSAEYMETESDRRSDRPGSCAVPCQGIRCQAGVCEAGPAYAQRGPASVAGGERRGPRMLLPAARAHADR